MSGSQHAPEMLPWLDSIATPMELAAPWRDSLQPPAQPQWDLGSWKPWAEPSTLLGWLSHDCMAGALDSWVHPKKTGASAGLQAANTQRPLVFWALPWTKPQISFSRSRSAAQKPPLDWAWLAQKSQRPAWPWQLPLGRTQPQHTKVPPQSQPEGSPPSCDPTPCTTQLHWLCSCSAPRSFPFDLRRASEFQTNFLPCATKPYPAALAHLWSCIHSSIKTASTRRGSFLHWKVKFHCSVCISSSHAAGLGLWLKRENINLSISSYSSCFYCHKESDVRLGKIFTIRSYLL